MLFQELLVLHVAHDLQQRAQRFDVERVQIKPIVATGQPANFDAQMIDQRGLATRYSRTGGQNARSSAPLA